MRAASISWFGEMQMVFGMSPWPQSPSLPVCQPKVQLPGCAGFCSHRAALWHQPGCATGEGHLGHSPCLLRVPAASQGAKFAPGTHSRQVVWLRASSPFLQLVWLVRHKPGRIPVHNKPSTHGKNVGCRDPELPQPSWEFPFKR